MFGFGKGGAATREVVTEAAVLEALGRIVDPDLRRDIVALGFVKDVAIRGGSVAFKIELTTPACPVKGEMERQAREFVGAIPGVTAVDVQMTAQVRSTGASGQLLPGVRNVIAIASGKGGVGKSTVAANLAVALARSGARVGLLDADIYGPSIPALLGLAGKPGVKATPTGDQVFVPPVAHGVAVMSLGFLLDDPSQPVIWRGPMVGSGISQLLGQSDWGELDYLLVDLPPGTGDATLTLAQRIPLSGVVIVSQPQAASLAIAIKALKAFQSLKVRVLGVLENMSTFTCDACGKEHQLFGHGGAKDAAERLGVPFLGALPLCLDVCAASDAGVPLVALAPQAPPAVAFLRIAEALAAQVSIATLRGRTAIPLRPV
ncbi:MAG: ATP-binding protein [Chloroflexi bacterium]|jgi:ATP-binding protein involved in chromosome partitioning|nr:ATP-binding protein [Chloroflexota bacterium]